MKERDIKDAYDNVEISQSEKNKIYNNILENRKKRFNWVPIIGFGALAAASFGLFMTFGVNKPNEELNADNNKENDKTIVANRNIKLENSYKKEIIVGAKSYLEANKIDLEKLEDGKEIVIETNKIVNKDDYKVCTGNLVIKRYNDDFSYSTDIKCDGEDKEVEGAKEFIIYSGIIDNVFEVDDYIAISAINNYIEKEVKLDNLTHNEIVDNDINLTIVDKEGKIVFNKLIESVFENENSKVNVIGVNKINDNYYVTLNMTNELTFYESGSIKSERNHNYILILDKDIY